jgi:hypothetical protein
VLNEAQLAYDGLHELAEAIRYAVNRAYPPLAPNLTDPVTIGESRDNMTDFIHKEQRFNSLDGTDFKAIHYSVDGASEPVSVVVDKIDGAFASVQFKVQQDAEYTVRWATVDDAGNVTAEKTKTLTAADDWAGDAPDEVGPLVTVGESTEE